jgi:uncharacterized protein involved in exopolysaccharide biosynthesis
MTLMTNYETPAEATPPELSIRDIVDVLMRRKAIFLQIAIVGIICGVILTVTSKPIYETRAKLLIASSGPTVSFIDSGNPIASMLAAVAPDSASTQLQVLQGPSLQGEARLAARQELTKNKIEPRHPRPRWSSSATPAAAPRPASSSSP